MHEHQCCHMNICFGDGSHFDSHLSWTDNEAVYIRRLLDTRLYKLGQIAMLSDVKKRKSVSSTLCEYQNQGLQSHCFSQAHTVHRGYTCCFHPLHTNSHQEHQQTLSVANTISGSQWFALKVSVQRRLVGLNVWERQERSCHLPQSLSQGLLNY